MFLNGSANGNRPLSRPLPDWKKVKAKLEQSLV